MDYYVKLPTPGNNSGDPPYWQINGDGSAIFATGAVTIDNAGNLTATSFSGDGAGLTNLPNPIPWIDPAGTGYNGSFAFSIDSSGANDQSVSLGHNSNGSYYGAAVGNGSNGYYGGAAVGNGSNGSGNGAAVGSGSNGSDYGAAMGSNSNGSDYGAAVGSNSNGSGNGAVVGYNSNGSDNGAVVGYNSYGFNGGTAVGYNSYGFNGGAAVGYNSYGYNGGAAVGYGSNTNGLNGAVAIGGDVDNVYPATIPGGFALPTVQLGQGTAVLDGALNFGTGATVYPVMNSTGGLYGYSASSFDNSLITTDGSGNLTLTTASLLSLTPQTVSVTPTPIQTGSLALTSTFILAVWNGTAWVRSADGVTPVVF
jgi:hypothetical protein